MIPSPEKKTYEPQPVLRVYIPKTNGKTRPLGIPVIKERVVQMSLKLVIEPIFEADFEDSSYGFRPGRSAGDAMRRIKESLQEGKTEVFNADPSSYFYTIQHKELLRLIGMRISDKNVLHLIKMWLKAPEEVAKELNAITRGWINYFTIKGVTYPNKAKRNLRSPL